ncbi:hypothetical protein CLOM_g16736 [Closterium sp. NIES-68]|nr:hypothetical protein CLOM_g16736 [Closterium sp. NIES-68]
MVQCTLIMGSILKNGKAYVDEEAEEEFMFRCLFVRSFSLGDRPPAPGARLRRSGSTVVLRGRVPILLLGLSPI